MRGRVEPVAPAGWTALNVSQISPVNARSIAGPFLVRFCPGSLRLAAGVSGYSRLLRHHVAS
jgi:hypothetical protein